MGVYEAVKDAAALAQEVGRMDLYRELLDGMKVTLDQQKKIQELEARNAELERALAFQNTLVFRDDRYWSVTDAGDDGPYCSRCWDMEAKAIRLHKGVNYSQQCPQCGSVAHSSSSLRRQRSKV